MQVYKRPHVPQKNQTWVKRAFQFHSNSPVCERYPSLVYCCNDFH